MLSLPLPLDRPARVLRVPLAAAASLMLAAGVAACGTDGAADAQETPSIEATADDAAAQAAASAAASASAAAAAQASAEAAASVSALAAAEASRQAAAERQSQEAASAAAEASRQAAAEQQNQQLAPQPFAGQPQQPAQGGGGAYYGSCKDAKAAGVAPLYQGEPGYRSELDRDDDGVACEK